MLWIRIEQSLPETDLAFHSELELMLWVILIVSLWFCHTDGNGKRKFVFVCKIIQLRGSK
jgi:hypothetical protein